MIRFNIFIAVTLLLFAITTSVFAVNIDEIMKSPPDATKFPDANSIILFSQKTYELLGKGKSQEESLYLIKVLTKKGRESLSDQKVPFDKDKDELKLIKGGTYKSDNTFIEIENKAINDITPAELAGAETYANYLHRVYSFPVVDPGVTLYMNFKKIKDLKETNNISDRVFFRFEEPMLKKELKIIVPSEKKLFYKFAMLKKGFLINKTGNKYEYRLTVKDMPQIKNEENMPPFEEISDSVIFSTCKSWNEAIEPISKDYFNALKITPDVKEFAANLTKGCSSEKERIMTISTYVAQKIRNVNLPLGNAGYKPNDASVVLKNKFGDCRDKSVLLISLLQASGIKAYPALFNDQLTPLVKEIPSLKQFNTILVAIPDKNGYFFIDPFAEMSQFGYIDSRPDTLAIVVKPQGNEFSGVSGLYKIKSKAVNKIDGIISENGGFSGTVSTSLYGAYDEMARYSLHSLRGQKIKMYFEEKAEEFCPQGQDVSHHLSDPYDLTKNMFVSMNVRADFYAVIQDKLMILKIPRGLPFSFSRIPFYPSLVKREYPYEIGSRNDNILLYHVKLPAGYRPIHIPKPISINADYGVFTTKYSYNEKTSDLYVKKSLEFTKSRISVNDYPGFKKNLENIDFQQNNIVLFERK